MSNNEKHQDEIPAIKVHQWLEEWNKFQYDDASLRRKPEPHFYMFTVSASRLKALSGIYRRGEEEGADREAYLSIQRQHNEKRSAEIKRFVQCGFPWSELTQTKRSSGEYDDLRKPGWLPTAIVVNILLDSDVRRGQQVDPDDLVTIEDIDRSKAVIRFPKDSTAPDWEPTSRPPLEIIDGQHRLWAFEHEEAGGAYELPVVAFHGLDISWQAYLFWTINVKPTRINTSLAFDLYPLLRTEDWLEKPDNLPIYRQTRAQELTEALWAHPESPWHDRIDMLGDMGRQMVSQAAWIRSLMATYIRNAGTQPVRLGGLFSSRLLAIREILPWKRAQQAAFLIFTWKCIREAVKASTAEWAIALRNNTHGTSTEGMADRHKADPAFVGSSTLLNTDQGVRAVLFVANDLCFVLADMLKLDEWTTDGIANDATDQDAVTEALRTLKQQPVADFLKDVSTALADYDWRSASAPGLTASEKSRKLAFRGSGGYTELRRQVLVFLSTRQAEVGLAAQKVRELLGHELEQ